jgi:hypothetical protein
MSRVICCCVLNLVDTLVPLVSDNRVKSLHNNDQLPIVIDDDTSGFTHDCSPRSTHLTQNSHAVKCNKAAPTSSEPLVTARDINAVQYDYHRQSETAHSNSGVEDPMMLADVTSDEKQRETSESVVVPSMTTSNNSHNSVETIHATDHVFSAATTNGR